MEDQALSGLLTDNNLTDMSALTDPVTGLPLHRIVGTAYHEAGHAVMATLLSVDVIEAVIDPRNSEVSEGAIYGFVRHEKARSTEDHAQIALAGFVAEMLLTGEQNRAGASTDIESLAQRFRVEGEGERLIRSHAVYIAEKCRSLLIEAWPLVVLVAEELLRRRRLSGADIARLVAEGRVLVGLDPPDSESSREIHENELSNEFWRRLPNSFENRKQLVRWSMRKQRKPPWPFSEDQIEL